MLSDDADAGTRQEVQPLAGLWRRGSAEVTAEDARGAGALNNKTRAVRVLNVMSADEAERAGVEADGRLQYFRVSEGRMKYAPSSAKAD